MASALLSGPKRIFKQAGKDGLHGPESTLIHANEFIPRPSSICRGQQRQLLGQFKSYETRDPKLIQAVLMN